MPTSPHVRLFLAGIVSQANITRKSRKVIGGPFQPPPLASTNQLLKSIRMANSETSSQRTPSSAKQSAIYGILSRTPQNSHVHALSAVVRAPESDPVGPFCVSSADFSLWRVDPGPFADAGRDFAIESPTAIATSTARARFSMGFSKNRRHCVATI